MMIIEIDKLVKRYGDFVALNHFDLQVQEGEVLGCWDQTAVGNRLPSTVCFLC